MFQKRPISDKERLRKILIRGYGIKEDDLNIPEVVEALEDRVELFMYFLHLFDEGEQRAVFLRILDRTTLYIPHPTVFNYLGREPLFIEVLIRRLVEFAKVPQPRLTITRPLRTMYVVYTDLGIGPFTLNFDYREPHPFYEKIQDIVNGILVENDSTHCAGLLPIEPVCSDKIYLITSRKDIDILS